MGKDIAFANKKLAFATEKNAFANKKLAFATKKNAFATKKLAFAVEKQTAVNEELKKLLTRLMNSSVGFFPESSGEDAK